MTEIVQEFRTTDGLGAMMWKKIYAMSYAYHHKLLFQDTPFEWFLVHVLNTYKEAMWVFDNKQIDGVVLEDYFIQKEK